MSEPARFSRQLDVLVDRNLAIQAGSLGTVAVMLLQAPAIGAFIGLAWRNQEPAAATYFVMAVAALWMGCMNACTAVVQERAIYDRERMFDLDIRAYLLSKLAVLTGVGLAQTVALLAIQGRLMHVSEAVMTQVLAFAILWAANTSGAALGLLISCCVKSTYAAVTSVPLFLIPQVIFSRLILQDNVDHGFARLVERLTITSWTYESLTDARTGWGWLVQLKCVLALAALGAVCLSAAWFQLWVDERRFFR